MAELSFQLQNAIFYGIIDTGYVSPDMMFAKCRMLADANVKIIQLRAKNEDAQIKRKIAFELLPIFQKPNAPFFIINDDIELASDICRKIENAGLHVGQDDCPIQEARKAIGKNRILGLSTHSIAQATKANENANLLDYFAVGPVYSTMTKPGRQAVGLELVRYVSQELKPVIPWFCIGGINLKTASEVRKAGGERIVAVSDVLKPDNTTLAVKELISAFNA